jgi:hypothetical protein
MERPQGPAATHWPASQMRWSHIPRTHGDHTNTVITAHRAMYPPQHGCRAGLPEPTRPLPSPILGRGAEACLRTSTNVEPVLWAPLPGEPRVPAMSVRGQCPLRSRDRRGETRRPAGPESSSRRPRCAAPAARPDLGGSARPTRRPALLIRTVPLSPRQSPPRGRGPGESSRPPARSPTHASVREHASGRSAARRSSLS